ncbi:hypothetical protein BDZ91DRAFT_494712 [Kalaharituber pfeilii]|nr:hypothetical protein BDZ91DRAFT_494712 [Kalaharituber pfeilii]
MGIFSFSFYLVILPSHLTPLFLHPCSLACSVFSPREKKETNNNQKKKEKLKKNGVSRGQSSKGGQETKSTRSIISIYYYHFPVDNYSQDINMYIYLYMNESPCEYVCVCRGRGGVVSNVTYIYICIFGDKEKAEFEK